MRTRPLAAALLLALTPVATATPARAQPAAEDPTTEMARARFKEGVAFYDKAQFEQARAAFLQAYALKKHPAVLLNLAWSSLKSGHALEAQRYFKQFLGDSKDITEKQRADANDGLSLANTKLGRIDVMAATGTEVTVDGDRVGIVPLADPIVVEPGAHTVKFKGPDGATDTDSVTVLAGEKAMARFAKTAAPAPSTSAAAPANPDAETSTAPEPPEAVAVKPVPTGELANGASRKSIFAAPSNVVPVVIGGVVVAASVGVAIGMLIVKQSAQSKADDVEAQIKGVGGTSCNPPGPPSVASIIQDACTRWDSDRSDVNTDATVGNVALGLGLVATAATVVYWLVADKGDSATPQTSRVLPVTPMVGPATGGLSLSGRF